MATEQRRLCSARYPANLGITCSEPPKHVCEGTDHRMGVDGARWPVDRTTATSEARAWDEGAAAGIAAAGSVPHGSTYRLPSNPYSKDPSR